MENNSYQPQERKMFEGNWKCAKCGAPITQLPFEPDPARLDRLLCKDCHRERRQSFQNRSFRY